MAVRRQDVRRCMLIHSKDTDARVRQVGLILDDRVGVADVSQRVIVSSMLMQRKAGVRRYLNTCAERQYSFADSR